MVEDLDRIDRVAERPSRSARGRAASHIRPGRQPISASTPTTAPTIIASPEQIGELDASAPPCAVELSDDRLQEERDPGRREDQHHDDPVDPAVQLEGRDAVAHQQGEGGDDQRVPGEPEDVRDARDGVVAGVPKRMHQIVSAGRPARRARGSDRIQAARPRCSLSAPPRQRIAAPQSAAPFTQAWKKSSTPDPPKSTASWRAQRSTTATSAHQRITIARGIRTGMARQY